MKPEYDPVTTRRLEQADRTREALLRHSAFRGARIERWYDPNENPPKLWLDIVFPAGDERETTSIEFFVGLPLSNAINARNAQIADAIAAGATVVETPEEQVARLKRHIADLEDQLRNWRSS